MAKRQNFIVGSTNAVSETLTDAELNTAWNRFEILGAGKLDGVFKAVSDYSNDSSNEIANAIQLITGSQPSGSSQTELADALQQMRNEIETTSLTFKGYIATSAPSSSTYTLVEGNLWINASAMPTTFPVAAADIQRWNGSAWVAYGSTYTPTDFDFWRNINDNEGYYWFGGVWTVMSTDMSTTYFTLNQNTGKWEIKSSVNLPGSPTTTTPDAADQSTKIATTEFAHNFGQRYVTNCPIEEAKDIKIELGTGTDAGKIIVRAGSKTYVPNGAGTFTPLTITSDLVLAPVGSATASQLLYITNNGASLATGASSVSGTSVPASYSGFYWNVSTNKINSYNSGTVGPQYSLPIALIHRTSGNWDKIEFVFNGIGYMGGRYFALPGLKGLTPRGRNADGTLNNTVVTTDVVKTVDIPTSFTGVSILAINQAGIYTIEPTSWEYNEALNFFMNPNGNGATSAHYEAAFATATNGVITTFNPKTAFRATDYYDFERRVSPLETADTQNVKLTGNQTIAGTKTFSAAAYGTPSDAVNSILTTVAKTKAANGYVKLGNGLIIQWGKIAAEAASATGSVNFPTAFTSTNYTVCMRWAGTAATNGFLIETSSLTTTGFAYYHNAFNTGVNPNIEKRWVAIGY